MSVAKTIRNFFIFFVSILGIVALYRTYMRRSGPLVRIVVFHDICDREWFESLIKALASTYHILSPEDFFTKRFDEHKINVLVTFDDGYASWIIHGVPVLREYRVHGLFFVNSGLLDVAGDRDGTRIFMERELMIRPREPLTWEGVRALVDAGHTIGSHGYHHYNLARESRDAVHALMTRDKERIEAELGVTITDCAYPFGTREHVNEMVMGEAENTDFKRGYTAISRFVRPNETFGIPRMCIEDGMTPSRFRLWIEGGYDVFSGIKSIGQEI